MPDPNVVDLSKYQTKAINGSMDIDFADLKANGIKAVIIQLGHGVTQDPAAEQFISQAKAAGLIVHGYHFYEYGQDNQVQWSIQNAKDLGLDVNAYYFLDMEGNIPTGWGDDFRPFYRNWKMAGWNVGIYASLSKFGEFDLKELEANGVYKWVADWDADQAPGIADIWQYNCSAGLGKYTLKLDKDVDITGKLIQPVKAPEQLETDPNGQYPVKAGAFVDFDYSTTSIVGGKMLISSPDGINKIPKLGPDGSFIFNQKDGDRMWVFVKDKIHTVTGPQGLPGTNGKDGQPGRDGTDGKSAYQIWLDNGHSGTETDFLDSLKGAKGDPGQNGTNGQDGKDAIDTVKTITSGTLSSLSTGKYEIECLPSDTPIQEWGLCDVVVGQHYAKQVFTVTGATDDDQGNVYVRVRDYGGQWHEWREITA